MIVEVTCRRCGRRFAADTAGATAVVADPGPPARLAYWVRCPGCGRLAAADADPDPGADPPAADRGPDPRP